jgi:hypothetical protein
MKQKKDKCEYCGSPLDAKTTRKRFCSDKCRIYAAREKKEPAQQSIAPGPLDPMPEKPKWKIRDPKPKMPEGLTYLQQLAWKQQHLKTQ